MNRDEARVGARVAWSSGHPLGYIVDLKVDLHETPAAGVRWNHGSLTYEPLRHLRLLPDEEQP